MKEGGNFHMDDKKPGFFKQVGITIFRPDLYGKLTDISIGRTVLFVILFSIIYMTIWWTNIYYTLIWNDDGLIKEVAEIFPDFYIEDSKLHLEERSVVNENGLFICADTDIEQYDLNDLQYIIDKGTYTQVMLISKTNIVMISDVGEINQFKFSDFNIKGKKTRDDLLGIIVEYAEKFFVPGLIILSFFSMIGIAIMGLIYLLFAGIIAIIFRRSLLGGQLYRIGLYTYAMQLVVQLIFEFLLPGLISSTVLGMIRFILVLVYLIIGVLSVDAYNEAKRRSYSQSVGGSYVFDNFDNEVPPSNGMATYQSNTFSGTPMGMSADTTSQGNVYGMGGGTSDVGYMQPQPTALDHILINGVPCKKIDLDLVNNYLIVGLRDNAVDTLCGILNCQKERAEDILNNWNMYYKL